MELAPESYRTLFESSPDGLALVDRRTGQIRECNERFGDRARTDRRELRDRPLSDVFEPVASGNRGIDDMLDQPSEGLKPIELVVSAEDASDSRVRARVSAVEIDGSEFALIRVSPATPTEHERQQRRARAVEKAPVGISISDPADDDNPLVDVNRRFQELTGYDADEILGRNCRFMQGPNTDPETVAEIRQAIDQERPITAELRNYRRDGTEFWNRLTVAPVRDEGGEVVNYVGFQEDVTDRRESERALALSRELLETLPVGVLRTTPDSDGTFDYVNPALVSLFGADSADQLRDERIDDFYVDPEERENLIRSLRAADNDRISRELRIERLDGEERDVLMTASLARDDTGMEHVYKVVQDITTRKERERALERYERLVEQLPIGVYQNTPGPDGEFTLLNDAMISIFDAESKEKLRERAVSDLYVDPEEREAFSDQLRDTGVVEEREIQLETLAGRRIWAAVTAISREVDGDVVFDGVIRDITARKEYEDRLEEQRDNLEILNRMLRHDIRNDLQLITAHAGFLADHVDEEGQEYVAAIQENAEHIVELTRTAGDMADVMLSADTDHRPTGLRSTLEQEIERLRSECPGAAVTVADSILSVEVTANDMLNSVFRNVLTNAVQHNDQEVPEITVGADRRSDSAVVRIADNGPGVPDEQKPSIFGKGEKGLESEGTGIGLYLVKTLVETYGGTVHVEDNDPRGAVFVVKLPLVD